MLDLVRADPVAYGVGLVVAQAVLVGVELLKDAGKIVLGLL